MKKIQDNLKLLFLILMLCCLSGCDTGFKQMGPTQFGIKFRRLPSFLMGGISNNPIPPGAMIVVWPWDDIYSFDTSVKDISWGGSTGAPEVSWKPSQRAENSPRIKDRSDFVQTRAIDGNEVALAVTVSYQVDPDATKLVKMIQTVATNDTEVRNLVVGAARADIRTFMNELKTSEYLSKTHRYKAVDKVKDALSKRLGKFGINILRVNLDDFRFERHLLDGTVDSIYQDKLKEIQKLREDTEREKSRINTIKAKKQQEFNDTQAGFNRIVAEADGFKNQAKFKGDAYFESKGNEAEAILAAGKAEVEGLTEKINALSGPGGSAILKLELAKQLMKNSPKFVVLNESNNGKAMNVKRLDANQLLEQIGIVEAFKEKAKEVSVTK